MTLDEFRQSLTATEPPAGLTHALAGLWWDAKGDSHMGGPQECPRTPKLIAAIIQWAEEIMKKIDGRRRE